MRIVGGSLKGHRLKSPNNRSTRPTLGRVKEALFSVIESILLKRGEEKGNLWEGLVVLDLYAGTGALGIEALSRGAAWADFVDSNAVGCQGIRENLAGLGLEGQGKVYCCRIGKGISESLVRRLNRCYDIILADPPYEDTDLAKLVETIATSTLIKGDTILIVEHNRHNHIENLSLPASSRYNVERRVYGDTALSIFKFGSDS